MLEAAAELFGQKGYDATSMDDIAHACGVTKPMLYAYFGSKEGLHDAMIRSAGNFVVSALTELIGEKDPLHRLHRSADVMIRFVSKYRHSWHMVFGIGNRRWDPPNISLYRSSLLALTVATFMEFQPAELPRQRASQLVEPLAHIFVGAAEAGALWWLKTPGATADEIKTLAADLIEEMVVLVKARFAAEQAATTP